MSDSPDKDTAPREQPGAQQGPRQEPQAAAGPSGSGGAPARSTLPPSPPPRKLDPAVLPILIGVLVLGGALAFLFLTPSGTVNSGETNRVRIAALEEKLASATERMQADERRMAALEQQAQQLAARPAGDPAALQDLGARLQGIETRDGESTKRLTDSLAALENDLQQRRQANEARLSAIEKNAGEASQQNAQRIQAIDGRVGEVENRAAARAAEAERSLSQRISEAEKQIAQRVADAEAAIAPRLAALDQSIAQRVQAATQELDRRVNAQNSALDQRLAAFDARVKQAESAERRVGFLAARGAIQSALEAGQPLKQPLAGLPGTPPPALQRYADTAPPTESALRLGFEDAARAARAAAEPQGQGVMDSALARIQGLVTVRRGDQVVVGDTAAGHLEAARRALDAGDLAAALQRLDALPPESKAAMRGWLDQAQGLLAAQTALRSLSADRNGGAG